MSKTERLKFIASSVYSGAGIGLLLGLIMGMSVSPVVQTVIGVLTGMLGALLGLENKLGKTETNESTNLAMNIKLGSFGFGVVFGILFGITVRSHGTFAPTISERVKNWTDAGYDTISAHKYVLYEKLGIDPSTGKTTLKSDEIQKANSNFLMSSQQVSMLQMEMDTTFFYGDITIASEKLKMFNNPSLNELLKSIESLVPQENHMLLIDIIRDMVYDQANLENYCKMSSDVNKWEGEQLQELQLLIIQIDADQRNLLIQKIKLFFCDLN